MSPHRSITGLGRVKRFVLPGLAAAALLAAGASLVTQTPPARAAEQAVAIPAPAFDETPGSKGTETAVLAGGCFWGVQGVFQHVKGVSNAVSGYAGGAKETAVYEEVGTGRTGHAEAVRITYDPKEVSYGQLLQIYFSVAHDPTQLNRQGPDSGTQYRSAIFPADQQQKTIAERYIAQLGKAGVYGGKIVTKTDGGNFYPAEGYHQDFLVNNPRYPYIVVNDLPKVENLKSMFPALYRNAPVLVANAKS